MSNARTTASHLVGEIEHIVRRIVRSEGTRLERRIVVEVQEPVVKGRGGTCSVVDSLGNTTFGIRWYESRPRSGDLVLVEVPPPGGTRRVVAIDREQAAGAAGIGSAIDPGAVSQLGRVSSLAGDVRQVDSQSFFYVSTYGAVGDGATDDTTALQDTIDAATRAGGGIVVCLPGAIHLTTGQVTIQASSVTLELNGATIRRASTVDATTDPVLAIQTPNGSLTKTSHSGVRNGRIDANSKAAQGLRFRSVDFGFFASMEIQNATSRGLLYDCWDTVPGLTGTGYSNYQCSGQDMRVRATDAACAYEWTGNAATDAVTLSGTWSNLYADYGYNTGSGDGFRLSTVQGATMEGLSTQRALFGTGLDVRLLGHASSSAGAATRNHLYNITAINGITAENGGGAFPSTGNFMTLNLAVVVPTVQAGADLGWIVQTFDGLQAKSLVASTFNAVEAPAAVTPNTGLHVIYAVTGSDRTLWSKTSDGAIHSVDVVGQLPYALPLGLGIDAVGTGTANLAAVTAGNAGANAIPIPVYAPLTPYRLTIRNIDTVATLRTAQWSLYVDRQDGTNSLRRVLVGSGFSFTPAGAASNQSDTPTTNPLLAPGVYWLVIRNTSAAVTFGLATVAEGTLNTGNLRRTTTAVAGLGATLDVSGWTAGVAQALVRLEGTIGNEAAAF